MSDSEETKSKQDTPLVVNPNKYAKFKVIIQLDDGCTHVWYANKAVKVDVLPWAETGFVDKRCRVVAVRTASDILKITASGQTQVSALERANDDWLTLTDEQLVERLNEADPWTRETSTTKYKGQPEQVPDVTTEST